VRQQQALLLPLVAGAQQAALLGAGEVLGFAAGAQHAVLEESCARDGVQQAAAVEGSLSLNTGMLPRVWKCSQARPWGSTTQCLSLRA